MEAAFFHRHSIYDIVVDYHLKILHCKHSYRNQWNWCMSHLVHRYSQFYIHRHPYDVFRSAAHMADTTYWYTYLTSPNNAQIQEFILRQYEILWDRYQEGKQLLLSLEANKKYQALANMV